MLARVLVAVERGAKAGMTTKDLANIAKNELKALGGQPSFLGYQGFPDVLCVSVNDEIVHGIPSDKRVLQEGDLVSVDFGVTLDGLVTDSAMSFFIGEVKDRQKRELLATTSVALENAISVLKGGIRVGDISAAAQTTIEEHGFGIVRDLVGHGVGHELHELPNIPNFGRSGTGPKLLTGMTVAIEPMVTLGAHQVVIDPDGWTVRTADGSLAAHFEHTILITENGYEILTDRTKVS